MTFVDATDPRLIASGTGQTLASGICAELRQAIIGGELPPGSRLHIDRLRVRFSVSLSPLREALSRLGSAGLVDIEDQRGYRVATTSIANLEEVIRLRCEFETLALREAIIHSDKAHLEVMDQAMQSLASCSRSRIAEDHWETLHRRFHLSLVAGCRMPLLLAFVGNLHDHSDRYRRLYLTTNTPDRDVPQEHRRIYEAGAAGEADLACALLRLHIQRTGANVGASLLEQGR